MTEYYNQLEFNYNQGITHAGVHHADEVLCTAMALLLNPNFKVCRVNKVPNNVPEDTIVYDIGGGPYDHHKTNKELRENEIPYASFGLMWRDFGHLLCNDPRDILAFDFYFIQPIDASDNGVTDTKSEMSQYISKFNPSWEEESSDEHRYECFMRAVNWAKILLEQEISKLNSNRKAVIKVNALIDEAVSNDKQYMIMDRFMPWIKQIFETEAEEILYVIFPSARGGWTIQCVPDKLNSMGVRKPLPWAGYTEDSNQLAPIEGLTFCYPGSGFMAAFDTKEHAIAAAKYAIKN